MTNIGSVLSGYLGGSGSSSAGSNGNPTAVNNQLVASFGSTNLSTTLISNNMVLIPNYYNLDMSSIKIALSVSDVIGTTAPTTATVIETLLKNFQLQTNAGRNLMILDGSQFDISNISRYLNAQGVINNSGLAGTTTTSTTSSSIYNVIIPMAVNRKWFPLELFTTYNTLASRAATLNSLTTSTVNSLQVFANYHALNPPDLQLKTISIPVAGTGTTSFNQFYDQGKTYYSQYISYGDAQEADAADTFIASSGTGITFTRNGSLEVSNAPLQTFIDKENLAYPNTVSAGVGHETGLINLFTDPFVATAATQFSINFTTATKVAGVSNTMRYMAVESL